MLFRSPFFASLLMRNEINNSCQLAGLGAAFCKLCDVIRFDNDHSRPQPSIKYHSYESCEKPWLRDRRSLHTARDPTEE